MGGGDNFKQSVLFASDQLNLEVSCTCHVTVNQLASRKSYSQTVWEATTNSNLYFSTTLAQVTGFPRVRVGVDTKLHASRTCTTRENNPTGGAGDCRARDKMAAGHLLTRWRLSARITSPWLIFVLLSRPSRPGRLAVIRQESKVSAARAGRARGSHG